MGARVLVDLLPVFGLLIVDLPSSAPNDAEGYIGI